MCKYKKGDRVFFDVLNTGIVRDVYPNSCPPQYLVKGLTIDEEKLFTSHLPIPEFLSQSLNLILTKNMDIRVPNTIGCLIDIIRKYSVYCDRKNASTEKLITQIEKRYKRQISDLQNWVSVLMLGNIVFFGLFIGAVFYAD